MSSKPLPQNLVQALRYFADPDVANEYVAKLRWPNGPVCPRCGSDRNSYVSTRRVWKCKDCQKQYSVKVGTIFEDSPIPMDMWLASIWLIANSKNGISSYELHRAIGITQKSAWFVLHRIRLAMQLGSLDKFDGETEADETFIGGSTSNMHEHKKPRNKGDNKAAVVGVLQRGTNGRPSQVRALPIETVAYATLSEYVRTNVKKGATLHTDGHPAYNALDGMYGHESVNHELGEYVRGKVHTNGIENFWALLKRGIHGTYVQVAPFHLFRYVDERVFTFNERDLTDLGRFSLVLNRVAGRRLTYAALTGKKK